MQYLFDQAILLLYCLCSLFFVPADAAFVIAMLTAVSFCALINLYSETLPAWLCLCACTVMLLFVPCFFLFAPLTAYVLRLLPSADRAASKRLCAALLAVLFAALLYRLFALQDIRITCCVPGGAALAMLLFNRTRAYQKLTADYRRMHDDDTEKKLLLQEKNQSLIENQDYEIYAATLRERNRIAREIHDNVGHMLARSILTVGALKAVNQNELLRAPIEQLDDTLNSAMDAIRESVHNLHEQSIHLEDALKNLIRDFSFCPVTLQYDMSAEIPTEVKYCVIAVAKEALVNISRHSNATNAYVTVREHPAFYQFSIRDNGRAKRPQTESERGIGINNMQSRVAALKGTMQILTENGFCIYITIPK